MCHWLTLAVPERAALAPLRAFGELEAVQFPALPEPHRQLHSWLLTDGHCSCALFRADRLSELERALLAIACAQPVVLAHRCFGQPPRGGSRLSPLVPQEAAAFLAAAPTAAGGWVRVVAYFTPAGSLPSRIGGARPIAFAVLPRAQSDGAVVAVLGSIEHVPGLMAMRCDACWQVLRSDWCASEAEARAIGSRLDWQPVG